jgi:GNAT superfamily N-acetyltransferase
VLGEDGRYVTKVRIEVASEQDVEKFVASEADRRFFLARLRRRGRRGEVFIAFDGARPVGYVYLRLEAAEEPKLRWRLARTPLLERLRVVPDVRAQGVGRELVAAAEESARRHRRRRIALGVAEEEPEPVGFYLRLGYAEWPHGRVRTFREAGPPGGRRKREVEYCRVFVKDLLSPA